MDSFSCKACSNVHHTIVYSKECRTMSSLMSQWVVKVSCQNEECNEQWYVCVKDGYTCKAATNRALSKEKLLEQHLRRQDHSTVSLLPALLVLIMAPSEVISPAIAAGDDSQVRNPMQVDDGSHANSFASDDEGFVIQSEDEGGVTGQQAARGHDDIDPPPYPQPPTLLLLKPNPSISITNPKSIEYFLQEVGLGQDGVGLRQIVAKAFARSLHSDKLATMAEVVFHIRVASHCIKLSSGLIDNFGDILEDLVPALINGLSSVAGGASQADVASIAESLKFMNTHAPSCTQDLLDFYLTASYSIVPNLAMPGVCVIDGHAYVSLQEIVAHYMAHGYEYDDLAHPDAAINKHMTIGETRHAKKVVKIILRLNGEVIVIHFEEWQDDFDPSGTKRNKNSVWIKTVRISPPPGQLSSQ